MIQAARSLAELAQAGVVWDARPPGGAMAPFLGARYTINDLDDGEDPEPDPRLALVRAYTVPALVGQRLLVHDERELAAVLAACFQQHVPVIPTPLPDVWPGALHKYLLLRHSVPAPPDTTTGQPMALEVYGTVVRFNNHDLTTDAGRHWGREYCAAFLSRHDAAWLAPERRVLRMRGHLELELHVATYANICFPGARVPVYF